jgi:excisionase family DNA binding protein
LTRAAGQGRPAARDNRDAPPARVDFFSDLHQIRNRKRKSAHAMQASQAKRTRLNAQGPDLLGTLAELLAESIPAGAMKDKRALAKALHDALDARDDRARTARRQVQMHIWNVNERLAYEGPATANERMLSTEEAARLMHKSRPHVAMLIDAGILKGGTTTPKGHRRVPESSVRAWLSERDSAAAGPRDDTGYKAAAREAGMYAIPEDAFMRPGTRD